MKEKMSYLDVLEETINFYSVDPLNRRSVDTDFGNCYYKYGTKNCAFARYMNSVDSFIEDNPEYNGETARSIIATFGMDVMREEVRHLIDVEFWCKLQILHDEKTHWDKDGINEDGIEYANKIKEYIKSINE